MSTLRPNAAARRGRRPRPRGRILLRTVLVLLGLTAAGVAPAAAPVHTFVLRPGLDARVGADGSLIVGGDLVVAGPEEAAGPRRGRGQPAQPFLAVTAEGAAGGQRGFSAHRDDDGDGRVDEDRLDGRDNDGDGRIDEDFAAIGDGMVVIDTPTGGHFTYHHWDLVQLRDAVFVTAEATGGRYVIDLAAGIWREEVLTAVRHDLAGRPATSRATAFVARAAAPGAPACGPDSGPWIGLVVLDPGPAPRVVLDGSRLEVRLHDDAVPLALVVAETRLQLGRLANEAVRVRRGVRDKVTGRQAPWIVPPLCARCRLADQPDGTWARDARGRLHLTLEVAAGGAGAVDPDLFRLGDLALGPPEEIHWTAAEGRTTSLAWDCAAREDAADPWSRLDEPLDHVAAGRIEFVFPEPDAAGSPLASGALHGVCRDGRPFTAPLRAAPAVAGPAPDPIAPERDDPQAIRSPGTDQTRVLREGDNRPTLSPHLLEGFPNPFRDVIQLRFQVPATMGEAFVWEANEEPPAGFEPMATIPWAGGEPNVSVKIYSLNGQELVTLFAGGMGPGENTVQWSGIDNYGRPVSSGTYFCKLQLDDWSVTRRLVFVR